MEDKIRRLCAELLATTDDEEIRPILVELRNALHQHIERLRSRFVSYPVFIERRTGNKVPAVGMSKPGRTVKPAPRND
jgi:hypothetical protein